VPTARFSFIHTWLGQPVEIALKLGIDVKINLKMDMKIRDDRQVVFSTICPNNFFTKLSCY
jgi:hypothetical protein